MTTSFFLVKITLAYYFTSMIRDNPGFQYLLISRKRTVGTFIANLILSICIPLTIVVSISAIAKTQTNPMEV